MTLTKPQRTAVLKSAAVTQPNIRIDVIRGIALAPQLTGCKWHYRTLDGRRIYHPQAYMRKGWSNMIYVRSTRKVIVGSLWLT